MSTFLWKQFIEEGNELYKHLITNFEYLIVGDNIMHFSIIEGVYQGTVNLEEIEKLYGRDIELKLIQWIHNEIKENSLYNRDLWKPFREQWSLC
jgi:hypothetical protein